MADPVKQSNDDPTQKPARSTPPSADDARRWREENAEAIRSMNEWVERNGLPLARYRQF